MGKTRQVSVTNSAATAVTMFAAGAENIRVMENRGVAGWPTSDFLVMKPSNTDVAIRVPAGSSYTFNCIQKLHALGDTLGYIQTVTGSTTFDVDEDSP